MSFEFRCSEFGGKEDFGTRLGLEPESKLKEESTPELDEVDAFGVTGAIVIAADVTLNVGVTGDARYRLCIAPA